MRSASVFGFKKVISLGHGKPLPQVLRGGEVELEKKSIQSISKLKQTGYRFIALEKGENSIELPNYKFGNKNCLILGNESRGIADDLLELADDLVEIPTFGEPHWFNVSAAATVAMYEFYRQVLR